MITNRSAPPGTVIPEIAYVDVVAAARWLCNAFGFRERLRIGSHRIQLRIGEGSMVVVELGPDGGTAKSRTLVRIDDVDAHHARAVAAGATIINPPTTHPYGERQYSAIDVGGHRWTFSQSVADSDPALWGGELVEGG
jgi:uncharacterized glyoxalase superfamily protein PhnB